MHASGIAATVAASDTFVKIDGQSRWWTTDFMGALRAAGSNVSHQHHPMGNHNASFLDKLLVVLLALTSVGTLTVNLAVGSHFLADIVACAFLVLVVSTKHLRNFAFLARYIAIELKRLDAKEVHHELYQES